ncbi:AMP-dependent synthetase [Denitratisoma sp. DHT3]|uniref:class I adenylate-forming enzyme family protein n=1 Tax=Denitratisoma sp. DHT3 TaxID=1981880 RepID=UPI001198B3BF|nr:class I adenylate-forming enzyme family protein [Denitratisoma sp. DHT3]QDX80110.1 AMP-dependent synthetase [Denitratisoma sp. DHT3]
MNLVMALEMAAECFADRIAVTSDGKSMTYGELLAAARTAAADIRASGCKYVGLLDINGLGVPIALFGAAYAGVPYVPMNYRLTKPEMEALLERIAPAYLVTSDTYINPLKVPAGIQVVKRDDFLVRARRTDLTPVEAAPGEPSDIAIQLFTSGTTGQPKAAVLRHENLMSYILGTVEFGGAAEEDAALISVPPYHIAGISAVLSSTYACRRMVQLPNFDAATWLQLCRDEKVTNAFVVPTMLSRVIDHLEATGEPANVPGLRAIAYGGGKMPLSVIEKAMGLMPGVDFTNAYGLTETSSTICLLDPEDHRVGFSSQEPAIRKRLASVGKPLGTIEIEIRDEDGKPLGPDEAGDIYVRGGQVAGEYLGLGSMLDANGWFPTRDRGYVDQYGYLYLDGRADDVIVRGGENISPGEIEDVLLTHPAVSDVAVVAVPDEQWGEAVGAAVVLKENAQASAEELQNWVKDRLRSSRVPSSLMFKDSLPYNEMGKILRRVIKQEFKDAR